MAQLYLLGTGGYHPSATRHTPCVMLPEAGLIFDAGTAFFRVRQHLRPGSVDVLLSHAHLDHCCGLTYLIDVLHQQEIKQLTLHARPVDLALVTSGLFATGLFSLPFEHPTRPLSETLTIRGWHIRTRGQQHPGGSVAFRLQCGDSDWAYVTDTTADPAHEASVVFVQGVDLLLHECYFTDEQAALAVKTGHSFVTNVARLAVKARVRRLVLIHPNPLAPAAELAAMLATARSIFPETHWGEDEAVWEV